MLDIAHIQERGLHVQRMLVAPMEPQGPCQVHEQAPTATASNPPPMTCLGSWMRPTASTTTSLRTEPLGACIFTLAARSTAGRDPCRSAIHVTILVVHGYGDACGPLSCPRDSSFG